MTTALEGDEGSASRPGRFLHPGKTRYPLYWVGPRAGLDRCGISRPHRNSIPDRPAHSLYRLRYPANKNHLTLEAICYLNFAVKIFVLTIWNTGNAFLLHWKIIEVFRPWYFGRRNKDDHFIARTLFLFFRHRTSITFVPLCIQTRSFCLTVSTLPLHYKDQRVNVV